MNSENTAAAPEKSVRLPSGRELLISSSPHVTGGDTVRKVMLKVIVALLPAAAMGVYWFGLPALRVLLFCMAFCVAVEWLWCRLMKKPSSVGDLSALLSGLLLGMNLPGGAPWWVCLLGAVIAIVVGKQVFGGLGHNLFNPVLVARVALLIALPLAMTTFMPNRQVDWASNPYRSDSRTAATPLDEIAVATPLGKVKDLARPGEEVDWKPVASGERYRQYVIGNMPGSIGETSKLALLLGGLMLLGWGVIRWQIPVCFVLATLAVTGAVSCFLPGVTPPPLFHLLTGGLLLGAIFMATDLVTSPITPGGRILFGLGCGVITAVIRIWGNYPEGVSFSILLMNAAAPLCDRACRWRPFGFVRHGRKKTEAK